MIKFTKQKKIEGFTLLETLVAVSIFSVALIGIMSVLGSGISNTNYVKQKMIATYLAQEGVEYVRNMRDTEVLYGVGTVAERWDRFKNNSNIGNTVPTPSDSGFTRIVSTTEESVNEVKISSIVTWTSGSGPQSINFSESLFNWIE